MRTLYLVRHAKSGHDEYVPSDLIRHLSARGYDDAITAAQHLKRQGVSPAKIVSSPAVRTWSTALVIAEQLDYPVSEIVQDASIYEAPLRNLTEAVVRTDDRFDSMLLVGHNPGMTLLTNYLCGNVIMSFPTAAVACISMPVDAWNEVSAGCANLDWMFTV
ncbi:MAG: SixA phosphatase family protein [Bacteroidota bacterium]|jgi:phosphohistidine phosphatase